MLKHPGRETPKDVDIHLIAGNYATHKRAKIKAWLARRTRLPMHFTPTSSSWMNLVERSFADITRECVRAGNFHSAPKLTRATTMHMAVRNEQPNPYRWKAAGAEILAKIQSAREVLAAGAQN